MKSPAGGSSASGEKPELDARATARLLSPAHASHLPGRAWLSLPFLQLCHSRELQSSSFPGGSWEIGQLCSAPTWQSLETD